MIRCDFCDNVIKKFLRIVLTAKIRHHRKPKNAVLREKYLNLKEKEKEKKLFRVV